MYANFSPKLDCDLMSKVSPDVPIHPNNIAAIQTHEIEGSISFFLPNSKKFYN